MLTGGSNFAGFMKSVESLVEEDFITFLKAQLEKVSPLANAVQRISDRICEAPQVDVDDVHILHSTAS